MVGDLQTMNFNSKLDDYSQAEVFEALNRIKEKFPAVFKWFFLWELEKTNDSRKDTSRLDQK